jgi:hypothetical protein
MDEEVVLETLAGRYPEYSECYIEPRSPQRFAAFAALTAGVRLFQIDLEPTENLGPAFVGFACGWS